MHIKILNKLFDLCTSAMRTPRYSTGTDIYTDLDAGTRIDPRADAGTGTSARTYTAVHMDIHILMEDTLGLELHLRNASLTRPLLIQVSLAWP